MKNIIYNKNGALLKVALLGVALAMSLVMFSKVYFENSYENFVPNVKRTYRITPTYVMGGVTKDTFTNLPGGIVGLLADYSPQVEIGTRFTTLTSNTIIARAGVAFEESQPTKSGSLIAADTLLFSIFPTATYGENPSITLSNIGSVMISRSLAEKMSRDGDPNSMIGVSIKSITIEVGDHVVKGFFDDFPENSDLKSIDIILPIDVMGHGKDGVLGNDRYASFVQIIEKADIAEVEMALDKVRTDNVLVQADKWGISRDNYDVSFNLNALSEYHSGKSDIKTTTYILSSLAAAMLIIAMLNYVLIAISTLVKRAKNIATRRCYGAPTWIIYKMLIGEALVTLILSLALALILILALQKPMENIVGITYSSLFGWSSLWIVAIISLFVLIVCGVIPAVLYSRIPLSAAFTRFKESKSKWKHSLLALQFSGAMLFVSLLSIIALQYNFVVNLNMGYNYDNLLRVLVVNLTDEERELLKEELDKLPGVKLTSCSASAPLEAGSGNDVWLPEDVNSRFNIQDLYSADENYAELLELKIIQGRNFNAKAPVGHEIMVSENFIKEMEQFVDWGGNAIGREVLFSEHSNKGNETYTICGVFKDFITGTAYYEDARPKVLFFNKTETAEYLKYLQSLMIKVEHESPEIIAAVDNLLERLFPEKMLYTESYTEAVAQAYSESKKFRDMVFYSGLIVLIITLIGLIGYTRDEI
ncbi:MAG: ABC transporter permease [Rikenellaceae bacterium]